MRGAGTVRFELVTRGILAHAPAGNLRILDIGGGYGLQAIMLARKGHSVVVLDVDAHMIALARERAAREPAEVRSRLAFAHGAGEDAIGLVGTGFDIVCCHSVLMYEESPRPLLATLVSLVKPGGLISVLSVNRNASAMRSGLQGRWREALASLAKGTQVDGRYLESHEHTPAEIDSILAEHGARTLAWYGVGVFTDHATTPILADNPEDVYEAEWIAGQRDPYRQIARCFHLLAQT